jgi:hypothetical protein
MRLREKVARRFCIDEVSVGGRTPRRLFIRHLSIRSVARIGGFPDPLHVGPASPAILTQGLEKMQTKEDRGWQRR